MKGAKYWRCADDWTGRNPLACEARWRRRDEIPALSALLLGTEADADIHHLRRGKMRRSEHSDDPQCRRGDEGQRGSRRCYTLLESALWVLAGGWLRIFITCIRLFRDTRECGALR
jgi:hypothetical protein